MPELPVPSYGSHPFIQHCCNCRSLFTIPSTNGPSPPRGSSSGREMIQTQASSPGPPVQASGCAVRHACHLHVEQNRHCLQAVSDGAVVCHCLHTVSRRCAPCRAALALRSSAAPQKMYWPMLTQSAHCCTSSTSLTALTQVKACQAVQHEAICMCCCTELDALRLGDCVTHTSIYLPHCRRRRGTHCGRSSAAAFARGPGSRQALSHVPRLGALALKPILEQFDQYFAYFIKCLAAPAHCS